jgi:microcystin-dependent protein
MSVPLTINGVTFQYPQEFDKHWGPTLTNWSTAVTNALVPITGGFLTVANNTTGIQWRNFLNTGYLALAVNASNQLTFNGIAIGATAALTDGHILVGNVSNVPTDVAMTGDITISDTGLTTLGALKVTDAQIATLAGIALTKLASTIAYYWYVANGSGVLTPIGVTASKVIISDSNGLPSASSISTTTLGYLDATSSVQTQLNTALGYSANLVPAGLICDFGGTVAPSGWLLCDGSSYATATYPALASAIGYNWGGSGANFNVPNFTRRTAVGSGGSGTATLGNAVGNVGGAETHTLTDAELPATGVTVSVANAPHRHTVLGNTTGGTSTVNMADSNASAFAASNSSAAQGYTDLAPRNNENYIANTTVVNNASGTINGSGAAHTIMQPSAVVLKIIKT